jgi:hypothetical protein
MERFAKDRESFLLHMELVAHAGRDPELAERFGTRSAALREAIAYGDFVELLVKLLREQGSAGRASAKKRGRAAR